MANGTHSITFSGSSDKFFTGNTAISFRDLQSKFRGPSTNNVKLSDYIRTTTATAGDPTVPDSKHNQNVQTSDSNMELSDYRNTIKEIEVTFADTTVTDYNADHVWVNDSEVSGDLAKNVKKRHIIPSGKEAKASATNTDAMKFDPLGDVHNLDIEIDGNVRGRSGLRGSKNANGSDGGNALYINPTSGSKIDIIVSGHLGGGGGGGAGGYDGNDGTQGADGNDGNDGSDAESHCNLNYAYSERTNYERNNYVSGYNRERCWRRRGAWWGRRERSRCRNANFARNRCAGKDTDPERCSNNLNLSHRGMSLNFEKTEQNKNNTSRERCNATIYCRYNHRMRITGEGGEKGNKGEGGAGGNKGTAGHGGHGAGVYASGTYNSGQAAAAANPGNAGEAGTEGNEGNNGNCGECYYGSTTSESFNPEEREACGNKGNDGNDGQTGNPGNAGTAGGTGGNWGEGGGNNARYSGGSGGAAVHGRSSHYNVNTTGTGRVDGNF